MRNSASLRTGSIRGEIETRPFTKGVTLRLRRGLTLVDALRRKVEGINKFVTT